jgi:transcriptional regulator with XRE-family HTH domain
MDVGSFLRDRRDHLGLSQVEVADRSGLSQATVSAIELGRRRATVDVVERVLAALGLQLRLQTEPLDADIDADIDAACAGAGAQRVDAPGLDGLSLLRRLAPTEPVVEGLAGAALHGAPVPPTHLDIVVARTSLDALAELIQARMFAERWSDQWKEWGPADPDPRLPGSSRWRMISGEFRVRIVDSLPPSVVVLVEDLPVRVRPLHDIEATDATTQRVLTRLRERLAGNVPG